MGIAAESIQIWKASGKTRPRLAAGNSSSNMGVARQCTRHSDDRPIAARSNIRPKPDTHFTP